MNSCDSGEKARGSRGDWDRGRLWLRSDMALGECARADVHLMELGKACALLVAWASAPETEALLEAVCMLFWGKASDSDPVNVHGVPSVDGSVTLGIGSGVPPSCKLVESPPPVV